MDRAQKALLAEEVDGPAVQETLLAGVEYFVESSGMELEVDTCWDILAVAGCKVDTEQALLLPEVTDLADVGAHHTVDFVVVDMAADLDWAPVDKASSLKGQRGDKGPFLVLLDHRAAVPYLPRDMVVET